MKKWFCHSFIMSSGIELTTFLRINNIICLNNIIISKKKNMILNIKNLTKILQYKVKAPVLGNF